jgi:hypothetical protein
MLAKSNEEELKRLVSLLRDQEIDLYVKSIVLSQNDLKIFNRVSIARDHAYNIYKTREYLQKEKPNNVVGYTELLPRLKEVQSNNVVIFGATISGLSSRILIFCDENLTEILGVIRFE